MMIKKFLYLQEVMKHSKMSSEALKSIQDKKFVEVVRYSFKNVNYYRNLWKRLGINVGDIRTAEDIKKLPVINKKIILKNYNAFISSEYKKYLRFLYAKKSFLFMSSTAGTSGPTLTLYFNPDAKYYRDAIYARAFLSVGYKPTKPMLYYWERMPQKDKYNFFGLFRKTYVPFYWDEQKQLELMQNKKPAYMFYYPSSLYFIARMILGENIDLGFKPQLIFTRAEILTEKMRKTIEDAFGSVVYDHYGANEFNKIAWECKERNGYHVDMDNVLVEIVDENYEEVGYGETGRVVVTGLVNKALPLIRYEIGDFAAKADEDQTKHSCGTNLPVLIKSIEGRYEHSGTKKNKIVTQRKILERILDVFGEERNVFKFQAFVNFRNKKIMINYSTFKNGGIPVLQKNRLDDYKVSFKRVKNVEKNKKNGKILLLEKA